MEKEEEHCMVITNKAKSKFSLFYLHKPKYLFLLEGIQMSYCSVNNDFAFDLSDREEWTAAGKHTDALQTDY